MRASMLALARDTERIVNSAGGRGTGTRATRRWRASRGGPRGGPRARVRPGALEEKWDGIRRAEEEEEEDEEEEEEKRR